MIVIIMINSCDCMEVSCLPSRFFLLPEPHPSGPGLRDFLIFFLRWGLSSPEGQE